MKTRIIEKKNVRGSIVVNSVDRHLKICIANTFVNSSKFTLFGSAFYSSTMSSYIYNNIYNRTCT